ncbi:sulfatase-like hydrolase/transferase [Allorhodopirellula heiligendammensis]|uniref:Arylsulfatase n=1 Tax=Allorhodopirellula heiligendammensis TaxID=2714739 RepID=A0A5C6BWF3_9BACT|nr:sulfatase-like hydrolase/transferase [Allorhodopirellula heiligendammensis]TWU15104.1 Arylsulfatase [Allorhodopirellula heiligendammensis]
MPPRLTFSFALLCLLLGSTLAVGADAPPQPPNVIFVLCDDMGYGDYGVFFQNMRKENADRAEPWHLTPKLDQMAVEGVQLRQHYCPAPVCAPSRASLLLGVHQGHSNVRDNQFDKMLENNHTLGTVMRGAGYATAAIGKWGLQGGSAGNNKSKQNKPGPQDWPGYPTKRGFDDFFGYVRHRDGHAHYPKEDGKEVWANDEEVSADLAGCYTADLFTARAKKWIVDQHSDNPTKPFFLYLAFDTPHAKLQLPAAPFPAGGGVDGGLQWTGEAGRMINTADGEPDSYMHPDYANQTWDHDDDESTAEQPWPDVYKRYAADVRRIDDCLGDLLKTLADLGIDDNTLVVFTTDNGPSRESYLPENYEPTFFSSFGPFDGIKRDTWEGGIRVGAVVRWPGGAKPDRISELPSQSHDWLPTFAELAGVAPPAHCDGTSIVPMLTEQGEQQTPQVYVEYFNGQKSPGYQEFEASRRGGVRKQMQAIRDSDWVGVRYNVQSHADPFEIYNVVDDPKQTKNLADQLPDVQQRMHDAVLRLRRPNASAPRPYDDELIPAIADSDAQPGVKWSTYAANTPWLARLDDLSPEASGDAGTIDECPEIASSQSQLITGMFDISADGKYTFTLPPGVTAVLRLHDATVLDAGFAPSDDETTGTIMLAKGKHPFRLYWRGSTRVPKLTLSGPKQ